MQFLFFNLFLSFYLQIKIWIKKEDSFDEIYIKKICGLYKIFYLYYKDRFMDSLI